MNEGLDNLRQEGIKWVDANRSKRFSGVTKLLTDLYPDNAHFIYELLQNAEDAHDKSRPNSCGASVVRFTLNKDSLEFEHNAEGLFSLHDVESITGIGDSSKADDPTSIGKFGVGFKAVFAYTSTPEIHSGEYHFRIRDLVVPDGVNRRQIGKQDTLFCFPFNNLKKPESQAVLEIAEGLKGLGDNTLLFLRCIRKIEYLLPNGELGTQERIEHGNGHVEIRSSTPGGAKEAVSHWLRFEKTVKVEDDDRKAKDCRIAIAYWLEADGDGKKKKPQPKIAPLDHGQVSIFFPAEKETSNLLFHLHAPFASTVARDSVRDCKANQRLRDHLAELVVESLEAIRVRGLLTVDFLATLPNPQDNLTEFYEPIREAIVAAFKERKLTPTRSSSHAPADGLYRGPARIQEVIDDQDLSLLTQHEVPLWAKNPPQDNQREARFLDSLGIKEWGWGSLASAFRKPHSYDYPPQQKTENAAHKARIEGWVAQRDDSWLIKLYALLGECHDTHGKSLATGSLRIIRVASGDGDQHVAANEAFFPPGDEVTPSRPGVLFVKPTVYSAGRSEAIKRNATSFLQRAGVRPYDAKALIEWLLGEYGKGTWPTSMKSHLADIRKFVTYWKDNPNDIDMFSDSVEYKFLYSTADRGDRRLCATSVLYLDSPYLETGLQALFDDSAVGITKQKQRLSDEYQGIKHFVEFAVALGVMRQLEICEYKATEMQGEYFQKTGRNADATIDEDYFINGFCWQIEDSDGFIGQLKLPEGKSLALSDVVWRVMSSAAPKVLSARYIPNRSRSHEEKRKLSFLVDYLAGHPWVPDRAGNFHCPKDLDKESLHPDFLFDDRNGWLTAIGFGEAERQRSAEYRERSELARSQGFRDAAHMELALKATAGMPDEELQRMAREREGAAREEFPEKPSADPERRRARMVERRENAPAKKKVQRERSIEPGLAGIKAEAKAYLRGAYANDNGKLICQCCRDAMPFKLPGTEQDYFEAVQFIRALEQRYYENYLALCPTCAAKYLHACTTEQDEIRRQFLDTKPDGKNPVDVEIEAAGSRAVIRFVATHSLDLKIILSGNDGV